MKDTLRKCPTSIFCMLCILLELVAGNAACDLWLPEVYIYIYVYNFKSLTPVVTCRFLGDVLQKPMFLDKSSRAFQRLNHCANFASVL